MKVERAGYLSDADTWYTKSPPTWAFPQPSRRSLQTLLTDDEIKNCGLLVLTKVDRLDLLDTCVDPQSSDRQGAQWLVRGAANDQEPDERIDAGWWPAVSQRMDDLREIASEEDLEFCATSAAAALAFLERLPAVRQPGIFLVGGNIRLVWDTAAGEQVGLQFRGSSRIQFVILQSDGEELGSTMGVKSTDAVLRMVMTPEARSILAR